MRQAWKSNELQAAVPVLITQHNTPRAETACIECFSAIIRTPASTKKSKAI